MAYKLLKPILKTQIETQKNIHGALRYQDKVLLRPFALHHAKQFVFFNPAIFYSGVSTQSYKINQLYQFLAPGKSSLSQNSGGMYNIQHEHYGFTPTSKTSAMWN